jgi:hypothetical protein
VDGQALSVKGSDPETIERDRKLYPYPRVGDEVYLATELHLTHGADDFAGGRCCVARVVDGSGSSILERALFRESVGVELEEPPGWVYDWIRLVEQPEELRAEYGDRRGYERPDLRPKFNE